MGLLTALGFAWWWTTEPEIAVDSLILVRKRSAPGGPMFVERYPLDSLDGTILGAPDVHPHEYAVPPGEAVPADELVAVTRSELVRITGSDLEDWTLLGVLPFTSVYVRSHSGGTTDEPVIELRLDFDKGRWRGRTYAAYRASMLP